MNPQREFLSKANLSNKDSCLEWPFSRTTEGYGRIGNIRAHRLSYEMHKGKIPLGNVVMHSCDNPGCINPHHLTIGLQLDNVMDMDKKGRRSLHCGDTSQINNSGQRHGRSKLTDPDVIQIRLMCSQKLFSQREIASMYCISKQAVSDIHTRRKWSHIP